MQVTHIMASDSGLGQFYAQRSGAMRLQRARPLAQASPSLPRSSVVLA